MTNPSMDRTQPKAATAEPKRVAKLVTEITTETVITVNRKIPEPEELPKNLVATTRPVNIFLLDGMTCAMLGWDEHHTCKLDYSTNVDYLTQES